MANIVEQIEETGSFRACRLGCGPPEKQSRLAHPIAKATEILQDYKFHNHTYVTSKYGTQITPDYIKDILSAYIKFLQKEDSTISSQIIEKQFKPLDKKILPPDYFFACRVN